MYSYSIPFLSQKYTMLCMIEMRCVRMQIITFEVQSRDFFA